MKTCVKLAENGNVVGVSDQTPSGLTCSVGWKAVAEALSGSDFANLRSDEFVSQLELNEYGITCRIGTRKG